MTDYCSIEGRHLARSLRLINAVVERRTFPPVLALARLSLSAGGLVIEGSNLDMHATVHADVIDGDGTWSVLVDPSRLARIAAVAGSAPITIAPEESPDFDLNRSTSAIPGRWFVALTVGDASYRLPMPVAADEFPDFSGERGALIEVFGNGHLVEVVDRLILAISVDDTRYYLQGLHWQHRPDGQRFAATDGHRLLAHNCPAVGGEAFAGIIPRAAVQVLRRHFHGADVKVFRHGLNALDFVAPGFGLKARLIDGTFPDIDSVILGAAAATETVTLPKDRLATAVRQIRAVKMTPGRSIRFVADEGAVALESYDPDFGRVRVKTGAPWPGAVAPFGFNQTYLAEMLECLAGDIEMRVGADGGAVIFRDRDASMTRLLMSTRV